MLTLDQTLSLGCTSRGLRDGELVTAVEEHRLRQVKHRSGFSEGRFAHIRRPENERPQRQRPFAGRNPTSESSVSQLIIDSLSHRLDRTPSQDLLSSYYMEPNGRSFNGHPGLVASFSSMVKRSL